MENKKPYYITTAIAYTSGKPHIGNVYEIVLADAIARFKRAEGYDVRFQTGTDEHGQKVEEKAKAAGKTPKQFVDDVAAVIKQQFDVMNTSYDYFIRTTDEAHERQVQKIFKKFYDQGDIYKGYYEGLYCQEDEAFYTKSQLTEDGKCPVCGGEVVPMKEEAYFFKMSKYADQLMKYIDEHPHFIQPESRKNEMVNNFLKPGLQDLCVSRTSFKWGIPVEFDPKHVVYVWIDALANYLTVIGYPDNLDWQNYWPADIQVIGKDILRFHAGIWPAILMGLGLPLPKTLLVHGHISSGGVKMSKSLGNVVDPNEIIDNYGLDAWRYYFSRHIPTQDDGDFTWEKFEKAYNNELGNDLGNLVSRVANMVKRYQSGVVGDIPGDEFDLHNYNSHMRNLEFDKAMDEIWVLVRAHNQYIENVKPWEIAKLAQTNKDEENHLAEVLAHSVGGILQIGQMLAPFMPDTADKIHTIFRSGVINDEEIGILFPKIYLKTEDPRITKIQKTQVKNQTQAKK